MFIAASPTKLALSRDGLTAVDKVVNRVGSQLAHRIADIARKVGADVIVPETSGYSALGGLVVELPARDAARQVA